MTSTSRAPRAVRALLPLRDQRPLERMYAGAIDAARDERKRALDGGATLDPKLMDQLFGP